MELDNLKKLTQILNPDSVLTSDEVEQLLQGILSIIKKFKDDSVGVSNETRKTIADIYDKLVTSQKDIVSLVTSSNEDIRNELNSAIESLREEIASIEIPQPVEQKVIDPVIETPQELRDKLQSLKDDERLDVSAIKGIGKLATQENVDRALSILDQRTQFILNKSAPTATGGSSTWGGITGTLSDQTDLQTALNAKQNSITTGTTSQYFRGDLSLATFPTALSSFTNDSGYITGNQSITLSGDISGVGTTTITTTIGAGKVTNAMLAGSIASSKLVGTDIATVGTITSGTWNGTIVTGQYGGTGVANTGKTITVSGNTTIGSSTHTVAFVTSANTSVTLPTSGTLLTTTGAGTGLTGIPYSLTGTANQVILSGATGNITFSLPQSIATTSSPQFGRLGINQASTSGIGVDVNVDGTTLTQGLRVMGNVSTALGLSAFVSGDNFVRFTFQADGTLNWGSGAAGGDTFLYRSAVNTLKTDNKMVIGTNLGIGTAVSTTTILAIQASSTSASSLRILSGTAPTSPVDGDMWYDGTNVKFRVGGTTKTFTLT
jgi:hypothetical protein